MLNGNSKTFMVAEANLALNLNGQTGGKRRDEIAEMSRTVNCHLINHFAWLPFREKNMTIISY